MLLFTLHASAFFFQSFVSALSDQLQNQAAQIKIIIKKNIPSAIDIFNQHLVDFDSNMTGIAKDYLSKTTLAKKQQLIQPKIQNLKVSQAAMLKVIDDIKISLSPLVSLELTKKICELYKLLRTTYKKNRFKGNLSAKDEDDVPLFLKQAVSSRRSLRNLDMIYTAMDELTVQTELKAGIIVKVEIFCGTFKAEYAVDDKSMYLENVIFETDEISRRKGLVRWYR